MKCEHCGKEINNSEFINKMAEFGANLMATSYYNLMQKQIEQKSGLSVKIEGNLYSERQTNTIYLRQITELTKKMNEDFDKKIKELKRQHIQEIKEAVKKARERQLNEDYPKMLLNDIKGILDGNIGQDEIVNKLKEYVNDYNGWFFNK